LKKVLIITYYWPPSGGAGVQRWLKFTKYLPEYGWQPIIYTCENPEYPVEDHTLFDDIAPNTIVLKNKIIEPYKFYKIFTQKKLKERVQAGFINENKKKGIVDKISVWIRGNFFIPDARMLWINPSAKYLLKYLKENPVDVLVSTGPPHSMHLIAYKITRKLKIPWLADFRDPWTEIDFYSQLMLTGWADRKHHKLEKVVLDNADVITAISEHCKIGLQNKTKTLVEVVTNGFDEDDYKDIKPKKSGKFIITHLGSMNADRNPKILWKTLEKIKSENPRFGKNLIIRLIGKTDIEAIESLKKHNLIENLDNKKYLPHKEAIELAAESSVLLLPINNTPNAMGILTGKLFDYIALKIPILCIGPTNGDASNIINKTNAGFCVDFDDDKNTEKILMDLFDKHNNNTAISPNNNIYEFSRNELTKKLVNILNSVVYEYETSMTNIDTPVG